MAFSPEIPPEHRIRLRGPWHAVWLDRPAGLSTARPEEQVTLPASRHAAFGDRPGSVRLSRRFGRPTGLDEGERVWLEVATRSEASALLNGEWLGTAPPGVVRFDVTARIDWRNRLDLDLKFEEPDPSDEPVVEVALVIEESWK